MVRVSKLTKLLEVQPDYNSLLDNANKLYENDVSRLRLIHLGINFGNKLKNDYIYRFYELFDSIIDFSNIYSEYVILQLTDDINKTTDKKSVQTIIDLFKQYGDEIPKDLGYSAASAAASAAYSTYSAYSATSAAYSAVWSAKSAARSTTWSANHSDNDNVNSEYLIEVMKRRVNE